MAKDADFNDLAFIHGPPPRVIWLRVGNDSTEEIEQLLATAANDITAFATNEQDAVPVLRSVPRTAR